MRGFARAMGRRLACFVRPHSVAFPHASWPAIAVNRPKIGLLVGCFIYAALFCVLLAGYIFYPRDQLLMLAIVGLPVNLIFYALADSSWGTFAQATALGLLGLLQYGGFGYLLGRAFAKQ